MKVCKFQIDANHAGQRLDNYLLQCCKGVPKSKIYQIIRTGQVRVNGGRVKAMHKLQLQDMVRVPPLRRPDVDENDPAPALSAGRQKQLEETILLEDENYLIINKPRDFAVHAGSGIIQGLIEQFTAWRQDLDFLQLCHRLDRETTGCLVMAKNRASLLEFQRQLPSFDIEKRYLALVHGVWSKNTTVIDAPLQKLGNADGDSKVVVQAGGKPAKTEILRVNTSDYTSLLEVQLVTGRTHQVRVHCQYAGHQIIGDRKYGDRKLDKMLDLGNKLPLGLHACQIAFTANGKAYNVKAAPDSVWNAITGTLGFDIAG